MTNPAISKAAAATSARRKPIAASTGLTKNSVNAKPIKAAPSTVPSISPARALSMASR